jgi:hypothetical protein
VVAALDFDVDTTVGRKLKDLAAYQTRDPKIQKIKQTGSQQQAPADKKYLIRNDVLYSTDSENCHYWRPVLSTELEILIIEFVHVSLGHLGTEKCMAQVANTFHVKSLGLIRKLISRYDICHRVKHSNHRYAIESRSHLTTKPGELCAVDLLGPLPIGRGGVS